MTAEPKRLTALFEDLPRGWAWYGLRGICGLSVKAHRARAATIDLYPAGSTLLCVYDTFFLRAGDQRRWPGTVWLTLGICAIPLAEPPRSAMKPALPHAIRTQAG